MNHLLIRTLLTGVTVLSLVLGIAPVYWQEGLPAWGVVESPNRGNRQNVLKEIASVATNDIWAVGEFNPGVPPTETGRRTLIEHWDGAAWTIVPSPNPTWQGMDYATLEGVDAVSANDVWAVGYSQDFASLRLNTLVEHWDGTSWTIVRSPNPAGINNPNTLYDVEAVSANEVWAVGETGLFPNIQPLILRWDGTRWRGVRNSCGGGLRGITVIAANDIWAVGTDTSCHYDGVRWTAVPIPPVDDQDTLFDVDASASNDVWAVGQSVDCSAEYCDYAAYATHWDGTQWTLALVQGVELNGVEALAPNDVWAVGIDSVATLTLILHWDGTGWTSVPSPPDPDRGSALFGIDALAADDLWAVGWFLDADYDQQTLVLQAPSDTQGNVVGDTNVSYATISWFGPESGATTTNDLGEYEAAGLLAGEYTFTAAYGGCTPDIATVTVIAGTTVIQNFQLDC